MKRFNEKEEEIMQILWKLKKAFVKDIIVEMGKNSPPYNTVSSLVRKLEQEGFVGYESFGKTHRYYPILAKEAYRQSTFRRMIDHYFGGSTQDLLSYFVEQEKIDPTELDELLKKLKKEDTSND